MLKATSVLKATSTNLNKLTDTIVLLWFMCVKQKLEASTGWGWGLQGATFETIKQWIPPCTHCLYYLRTCRGHPQSSSSTKQSCSLWPPTKNILTDKNHKVQLQRKKTDQDWSSAGLSVLPSAFLPLYQLPWTTIPHYNRGKQSLKGWH